jgi:transposase InsO family protein
MTDQRVRLAIGEELVYDGEHVEIVDIRPSARGNEILISSKSGKWVRLVAVSALLAPRGSLLPVGEFVDPGAEDEAEPLGPALADLTRAERNLVLQRAEHVREALTGYRSGSSELAQPDEPRPGFEPAGSLNQRLEAKATELDVTKRTLQRWIANYRRDGEAGLAQTLSGPSVRVDPRWTEIALEVMVEHTDQSRPSRTMVIDRTDARVKAKYEGEVACPSRSTAFRVLEGLERRHPTFRLSTKRNRDIAERPDGPYGKLRPTRPGEYLLMDTTRLDVFGLDPLTLRWVQAELTVGMDWYDRCITGLRITPVSTKSVDAAATLYQTYRPPPSGRDWPAHAVWPEHGPPRSVLIDRDAVEGPIVGASGPRIVPETIVIDHGKIYISEHLTSVCQRLGISIQPARLRTGRDKGPIERFFRTLREDVLQAPGPEQSRQVIL